VSCHSRCKDTSLPPADFEAGHMSSARPDPPFGGHLNNEQKSSKLPLLVKGRGGFKPIFTMVKPSHSFFCPSQLKKKNKTLRAAPFQDQQAVVDSVNWQKDALSTRLREQPKVMKSQEKKASEIKKKETLVHEEGLSRCLTLSSLKRSAE